MGDIAKRKAWHQDPKLELCTALPELAVVLESVRRPSHITPGLVSRLYHTERDICEDAGKRKHNVTANPNDLACLGEDSIGIDLHKTHFSPELNLIRKPNSFVGLKNLGATCYMNCMLQALFHNSAFRAGLYAFSPVDKESESPVIYQLQLLFGFLELGVKAYYDPTPFTTEIGLAPQVQQDVQEFFKALSTYLEEQFASSTDARLRTLVQDLFSGKMAYVTQCKSCKTESKTSSAFYELDMHIDNVATIEKSIENYIRPEELTGSNQYHCGNCDAKRDAARFIEITSELPQILNFQLMRFVFDWETETKKKVKTAIEFPEFLDMNKFVRSPEGDNANGKKDSEDGDSIVDGESGGKQAKRKKATKKDKSSNPDLHYRLAYVLVHRGQSAYGGHYIAFVRDEATGTWWKFNDETAEVVTDLAKALASNVDLAPGVIKTTKKTASENIDEDGEEEAKPTTKSKKSSAKRAAASTATASKSNDSKGSNTERWKSSSAYMLGYTRVGMSVTKSEVPAEIASQVQVQNDSFQSVVERQKDVLKSIDKAIKVLKTQREQLVKTGICAPPDNPNLPVLPKKNASDASSAESSNMESENGDHNAVELEDAQGRISDQLEECQWISTEWYSRWLKGGDTNMEATDENETIEAQSEAKVVDITESSMDIDTTASKSEVKNESDKDVVPIEDDNPPGDGVVIIAPPVPSKPAKKANFALLCEHGRMDPLKITEAKRISTNAWNLLTSYVPFGPSLDKNSFCVECSLNIIRYGANKNEDERSKSDILSAIKTPDATKQSNEVEPTYWISRDWLASYSKKMAKNSDLDPTINTTLQCPHGLLSPESRLRRRIPATQWSALKSAFPAAIEFPSVLTTAPVPKTAKEAGKVLKPTSVKAASAKRSGAKSASQSSGKHDVTSYFVKKSASQASASSSSSGTSSATAIDLDGPNDATAPSSTTNDPTDDIAAPKTEEPENLEEEDEDVLKALALSKMEVDESKVDLDEKEASAVDKTTKMDQYSQISATSLDPGEDEKVDDLESDAAIAAALAEENGTMDDIMNNNEEIAEILTSSAKEEEESESNMSPSHHSRASVRLASIASSTPKRTAPPAPSRKPRSPKAVATPSNIPANLYTEEEAEKKDVCPTCLKDMHEDTEARDELAKRKTSERRKFQAFLQSIPSSIHSRLQYSYTARPSKPGQYYLVSLPWAIEWRLFLKDSEILKVPEMIPNSTLVCAHGRLLFEPSLFFNDTEKNTSFAIASADTFEGLKKIYKCDRVLGFVMNANGVCDGYTSCYDCMEKHNMDREIQAAIFEKTELYLTVEDCRTNKRKRHAGGLSETSRSRGNKKHFISGVSYTDTVGTLKMKIFEKYDVPPAELVLINNHGLNASPTNTKKEEPVDVPDNSAPAPDPIVLENEEKTLEFYGVRSDHALTVRLVDPMDRDVYKASDERNAGFGATVLMGKRNNAASGASTTDNTGPGENSASNNADTSVYEENAQEKETEDVKMEVDKGAEKSSTNGANGSHKADFDDDMDEETRELIEKLTQEDKEAEASQQKQNSSQRSNASSAPHSSKNALKPTKLVIEDDEEDKEDGKSAKKRDGEVEGTKNDPVVLRDASSLDVGSWVCSNCSTVNIGFLNSCEECHQTLPGKTWTCDRCQIQLQMSFSHCPQCGNTRLKKIDLDDFVVSDEENEYAGEDDDDYTETKRSKKRKVAKKTVAKRTKRELAASSDDTGSHSSREDAKKRRSATPLEDLDDSPSASKRSKQL